jgi:hypothetical protein
MLVRQLTVIPSPQTSLDNNDNYNTIIEGVNSVSRFGMQLLIILLYLFDSIYTFYYFYIYIRRVQESQ